eukprot:NODE_285_length_1709_cov_279.207376.p1 GENE.NODE_285_length_1709_cov_279.207376~~NODE_285_length_1709_cov_279.207376.p1  ORF type:complete len:474 (-),score=138.00 NODE_285_length_1709_cov_279.207376:270-1691(-)
MGDEDIGAMTGQEDLCLLEPAHEEPKAQPAAQSNLQRRRARQRASKQVFKQQEMMAAALQEHESGIEAADDVEAFQVVAWFVPLPKEQFCNITPPPAPAVPMCASYTLPEQFFMDKEPEAHPAAQSNRQRKGARQQTCKQVLKQPEMMRAALQEHESEIQGAGDIDDFQVVPWSAPSPKEQLCNMAPTVPTCASYTLLEQLLVDMDTGAMTGPEDGCPLEQAHKELQTQPAVQSNPQRRRACQRACTQGFKRQGMMTAALQEHESEIEGADDIEDFQVMSWFISSPKDHIMPPPAPTVPMLAAYTLPEQLFMDMDTRSMIAQEDWRPLEPVREAPEAQSAAQSNLQRRRARQRACKQLFKQREMMTAALQKRLSEIEGADSSEDFQIVLSFVPPPKGELYDNMAPPTPTVPMCGVHTLPERTLPEQLFMDKDLLGLPSEHAFRGLRQEVPVVRTFIHFARNHDSPPTCRSHSA